MKLNEEQHVDAVESKNISIKKIDPSVLNAFREIAQKEKPKRVSGALNLLKHLVGRQNGEAVSA